jgi:peptidoglycan/LPS O-acetylase OafA/YrhL
VRWLDTLFANRFVAWLGLISYSLYLWHYPVAVDAAGPGLVRAGSRALGALLALGASLLVSWLSYRFVERPFLREYVPNASGVPARAAGPERRTIGPCTRMITILTRPRKARTRTTTTRISRPARSPRSAPARC